MLVVYDLEVSGHHGTENCMETWYNSTVFLNFAEFFCVIFLLQKCLDTLTCYSRHTIDVTVNFLK